MQKPGAHAPGSTRLAAVSGPAGQGDTRSTTQLVGPPLVTETWPPESAAGRNPARNPPAATPAAAATRVARRPKDFGLRFRPGFFPPNSHHLLPPGNPLDGAVCGPVPEHPAPMRPGTRRKKHEWSGRPGDPYTNLEIDSGRK